MPFSGCDDNVALSNIRDGKTPERPSGVIPDPVWQLLQKCWSMKRTKRPSATQVYDALSNFRSVPPVGEDLPGKLELEVLSIKIPFTEAKKRRFFVKFTYLEQEYTTALTTSAEGGGEYRWFALPSSPSSLLSLSICQERYPTLVYRNG